MWLLVAREPRPDAPDWPGRRMLAAVDAVVWPLLWVLLVRHAPEPVGLVGPFVTAMAVLLVLSSVVVIIPMLLFERHLSRKQALKEINE